VVLGTGGKCSIRFPPEADMEVEHVAIDWVNAGKVPWEVLWSE